MAACCGSARNRPAPIPARPATASATTARPSPTPMSCSAISARRSLAGGRLPIDRRKVGAGDRDAHCAPARHRPRGRGARHPGGRQRRHGDAPSAPSRSSADATRATLTLIAMGGNGGIHAIDLGAAARHRPRDRAAAVRRVLRRRHAGGRCRAHPSQDHPRAARRASHAPTSRPGCTSLTQRDPPALAREGYATERVAAGLAGRPAPRGAGDGADGCHSRRHRMRRAADARALSRRIPEDLRLSRRNSDRAGQDAPDRPRPAAAFASIFGDDA